MGATCSVDGCNNAPEGDFELDTGEGFPVSVVACTFHVAALKAGERYEFDYETTSIRIGQATNPELITYRISGSHGSPDIMTLVVGHDGIPSQELSLRVTPKLLKFLNVESTRDLWFRDLKDPGE